jgi:phosphohistidine phosphatase SixA
MRSLVAIGLFLFVGCAHAPPASESTRVVIVVRHTEKAKDDPKDPTLSDEGKERARRLDELLAGERVTHLFATHYRRTQLTLAPLAERIGKKVVVFDANDKTSLLEALRALPGGSVAVVAGHSDTVPGIVRALGGEVRGVSETGEGPKLEDHAYDRLFIVILGSDGRARFTIEFRYGAASAKPQAAREDRRNWALRRVW